MALRLDAMKDRNKGTYSDSEAMKMIVSFLEIKTRVAASSLRRSVTNISPHWQNCDVGHETFLRIVLEKNRTKLLHQCVVM